MLFSVYPRIVHGSEKDPYKTAKNTIKVKKIFWVLMPF